MESIYNSSKLPETGTSIFVVMSKEAKKYEAVNLSQGFPDFPVDEKLIELVYKYMRKGFNQYAPMPGVPVLLEKIAAKIKKLYNLELDDRKEITITAGATQAIFTIIQAFVFPGDEVIILEPAYDSYAPSILLAGGKPVYIRLKKPDFQIPWEELNDKITSHTRMIIVNTPNNPAGYVFSSSDWKKLDELTRDKNILILSDEVYEHIIFDGLQHQSILKQNFWADRGLAVFSFGKTFHATGWKTGYVVAPPHLTFEFRKVHQFNVFSVNTPVQYALAEYISEDKNYLNLPSFYQEKRDFFMQGLQGSRWKYLKPGGTYFIHLDYSEITDEDDFDFALRLTREYKVASIPVSFFYHDRFDQKLLRFCFAKQKETLEKALERLHKI